MLINLGLHSNNNLPYFGRADRLKEIKRVPGITCALCGKKVIMEEAYEKAFQLTTKSLQNNLKKGCLDRWKEKSLIWEILNVYAKLHPKDSLDKIVQRDEEFLILKRAVVKDVLDRTHTDGADEASRKEILDLYRRIIQDSRGELRSANVVLRRFAKFKEYLQGIKLNVFKQLEIYAQQNPRKRLEEIINMPEVAEYHGRRQKLNKKQINMERNFHFNNIESMVKKANPDALEDISKAKEEALKLFYSEFDKEAKIYKIKKIYSEILEKYGCQKLQKKVFKEIEQLPTTYVSLDGFFSNAQAKKYNDFSIINSIIGPFLSSYEHIIARSKGGPDALENGVVLHSVCNRGRGNEPYIEVLEYHPELNKNSKKQIRLMSNRLLKGTVSDDLRYWPLKVSDTLRKVTNNKVNPDVTEYCRKRLKAIVDKLHSDDILELADANRQRDKFSKYLAEHEKDF